MAVTVRRASTHELNSAKKSNQWQLEQIIKVSITFPSSGLEQEVILGCIFPVVNIIMNLVSTQNI